MRAERSGPYALREYAVVADGERAVLVGPNGDCAWMCFPSWESPAVFDTLAGGVGGYSVRPADAWHVWGGYYEECGLIWRRRWVTGDGLIECREALARPASRDRAVLLRRLQVSGRAARVHADLAVRADFSRHAMTSVEPSGYVWTARAGGTFVRWTGAPDATLTGGHLTCVLDVVPGRPHDLVLELSRTERTEPLDPDALWEETERSWRASVPRCQDTIAPRDAQLAYAVLSGLTSTAGGMVAAATSSLPERAGGSRNYDYRYAWIRDQCYAGQAVAGRPTGRRTMDPGGAPGWGAPRPKGLAPQGAVQWVRAASPRWG